MNKNNLIKIKLDNMSGLDKVDYLYGLGLEENKIYNVVEHDKDYYKLTDGIKQGLWISKRVCKVI